MPKDKGAAFAPKTSRSSYKFLSKKDWSTINAGSITVFDGPNVHSKFTVKADTFLSLLKFLACDRDENTYIYTEENDNSGDKSKIKNRAFVKKYGLDGSEKGLLRFQ